MRYQSATPLVYEVKADTNIINSFSGLDYAFIKGDYEGEKIEVIRFSYNAGSTKKHTISNLHFSVYGGRYLVSGLSPYTGENFTEVNYDGYKWAFGASASLKAGANFNFNDFRIGVGVEPNVNFEFGDYYSFRVNASKKGIIENGDGLITIFFNVFPYFSYYFDNDELIAFQCNLGLPGFISPILSYQSGNGIFWVEYIPPSKRIDIGYMLDFNSIKAQF
ncbi:MAG: hypothetical protein ACPL25_09955 [Ignavibacteria bacterium]